MVEQEGDLFIQSLGLLMSQGLTVVRDHVLFWSYFSETVGNLFFMYGTDLNR